MTDSKIERDLSDGGKSDDDEPEMKMILIGDTNIISQFYYNSFEKGGQKSLNRILNFWMKAVDSTVSTSKIKGTPGWWPPCFCEFKKSGPGRKSGLFHASCL